jgi:hypothetical protein
MARKLVVEFYERRTMGEDQKLLQLQYLPMGFQKTVSLETGIDGGCFHDLWNPVVVKQPPSIHHIQRQLNITHI